MPSKAMISQRWKVMREALDERQRRLLLGVEAKTLGRGGVSAVAAATGVSRTTIMAGLRDIETQQQTGQTGKSVSATPLMRTRQAGAGRKKIEIKDETLLPDLLALMNSAGDGHTQSPLSWTCKSLRHLAEELKAQGHSVSHVVVGKLLKSQHYSLQSHAKSSDSRQGPDRHAQFEHINTAVAAALRAGLPVISVRMQKRALAGPDQHAKPQDSANGKPAKRTPHNVIHQQPGGTSPWRICDSGTDEVWMSVGTDHHTCAFAVQAIRRWWFSTGEKHDLHKQLLLITEARSDEIALRQWSLELSRFMQETGLDIQVHHLPPGTTRWNQIAHRLRSFMTMNWHAQPLVSHEVIISLIASSPTSLDTATQAEPGSSGHGQGPISRNEGLRPLKIGPDKNREDSNCCTCPSSAE